MHIIRFNHVVSDNYITDNSILVLTLFILPKTQLNNNVSIDS